MKKWLPIKVEQPYFGNRRCSWQTLTHLLHFCADAVGLWSAYAVVFNSNLSSKKGVTNYLGCPWWMPSSMLQIHDGECLHGSLEVTSAEDVDTTSNTSWKVSSCFVQRVSRHCRQNLTWLINILRNFVCWKILWRMPSNLIRLIVWRSLDIVESLIIWNSLQSLAIKQERNLLGKCYCDCTYIWATSMHDVTLSDKGRPKFRCMWKSTSRLDSSGVYD